MRPVNAPDALADLSTAAATQSPHWRAESFLQGLGPAYGSDLTAQAVAAPHWVARSEGLARALGWAKWLDTDAALAQLSGQPSAGLRPHASVYSSTSLAYGPASWVTAARCCWEKPTRRSGRWRSSSRAVA